MPTAAIVCFDQCEFGQVGRAPTAISSMRVPKFHRLLRETPGGGFRSHGPRARPLFVGWNEVEKRWRSGQTR
eukprot:5810975-Pyramimonas_sp.AAC.1